MLQHFFLICAGVDTSLLQGAELSTERMRLAANGAFVFMTAIFAAVFMAFAIARMGQPPLVYCSFAGLWSLFIFSLDRQIVMSIKKTYGFAKQLRIAALRILIAIGIGIVISKPFELWLFQSSITQAMIKQDEARQQASNAADNQAISNANQDIKKQINDEKQEIVRIAQEIYNLNATNKEYSGKIDKLQLQVKQTFHHLDAINDNKSAQAHRDFYKNSYSQNNDRLKTLQREIDEDKKNKDILDSELQKLKKYVYAPPENGYDLLDQLNALDQLTEEDRRQHPLILWNLRLPSKIDFISLLFIIIELMPVLMKLMLESGDYDKILIDRDARINTRIKEGWNAFHATSTIREQSYVQLESNLIKTQVDQINTVVTGEELDSMLKKSRMALAATFARAIAKRLVAASADLSKYNSMSHQDAADMDREVRRAVRDMTGEKGTVEIIKGRISGIGIVTVARMRTTVNRIRHAINQRHDSRGSGGVFKNDGLHYSQGNRDEREETNTHTERD